MKVELSLMPRYWHWINFAIPVTRPFGGKAMVLPVNRVYDAIYYT